jgi:hypothetical protein
VKRLPKWTKRRWSATPWANNDASGRLVADIDLAWPGTCPPVIDVYRRLEAAYGSPACRLFNPWAGTAFDPLIIADPRPRSLTASIRESGRVIIYMFVIGAIGLILLGIGKWMLKGLSNFFGGRCDSNYR